MPGDTSLVKKVKNSNLKMLEVKSQRKNHDSDDTKSPRQEAVNDDSNILTGKPILVLIFVSIRLGIFQQFMINLERVVSIGSRESRQCSTNVIGAF